MESDTIYQPAVPTPPPEPSVDTKSSLASRLAAFSPKLPPKMLYLVGGIAVILLTLALAISFFGRSQPSSPTTSTPSDTTTNTVGFVPYTNTPHFFTISLPPSWVVVETSPSQEEAVIVQTDAQALLEIKSFKASEGSLDDYLASLSDGRSAIKSTSIKAGAYDGVERSESWAKTALQPVVTYVQIQDKMYVFTLLPSGGKSAIVSESLLRDYRSAISTFTLTSVSGLGQDWKEYVTSKVDGLTFPPFTFTHPQSWAVTEKSENKNLIISIYRNNYEIAVTQAEVGTAVCLFKDSPPFQGSSGDLRDKEYSEFTNLEGTVLRRYFNQNQGDKSTFFFCQKDSTTPYFSTPTLLGGIVYYVPAKFDQNIVKEMDEIVKTFAATSASPSAAIQ